LERAGHTEGSVDLARLAGFKPAAVICEIMNDDGTMARLSDLEAFSKKHGIPIVSIADLVAFRLFKESLIEEVEARQVETEGGTFEGRLFKSLVDGTIHFALIKASSTIFSPDDIVDVRVHRQRTLVDVFAAAKVGGHQRITYGYEMLKKSNAAVFVYLTSPEPQISLPREFEELGQRTGSPTTSQRPELDPAAHSQPMDSLMLGVGAQILRHLGVRKMRVHMSNPMPLRGLLGFDLDVVDTVEIPRD
jgi:3,4-dihydroxy 2-butanone 4-phosphate synthase/GTP cyclohydrolase II